VVANVSRHPPSNTLSPYDHDFHTMTDRCAVHQCPFAPNLTLLVDELRQPQVSERRTLRLCGPHGGVLRFALVDEVVTALGLEVTESNLEVFETSDQVTSRDAT
jgi:hypothetical protein